MRSRGVEVFLLPDLLAETLAADDAARTRLIELVASDYTVGASLVDEVRSLLAGLAPADLATHLIGGLTVEEAGLDLAATSGVSLIAAAIDDPSQFVLPPLPNTLFTRDSSCWIYGGVSVNPMFWPARRREAYNVAAIYRAHPMFADADFEFWYPHLGEDDRLETQDFGLASMEGGDVMPIGNGAVLIGMSERTQGRMIEQIAKALFAKGAADRVIACVMTKDRAHMHLDTVFTLLDRDKATAYPSVVGNIRAISLRPGSREGELHVTEEPDFIGAVADALGVPKLHVVETGGDRYEQEREQWDDGNNVVALEPGVVVAYERNTYTIAKMREAGVEVVEIAGFELGQGPRRWALHDVPDPAGWPRRLSADRGRLPLRLVDGGGAARRGARAGPSASTTARARGGRPASSRAPWWGCGPGGRRAGCGARAAGRTAGPRRPPPPRSVGSTRS